MKRMIPLLLPFLLVFSTAQAGTQPPRQHSAAIFYYGYPNFNGKGGERLIQYDGYEWALFSSMGAFCASRDPYVNYDWGYLITMPYSVVLPSTCQTPNPLPNGSIPAIAPAGTFQLCPLKYTRDNNYAWDNGYACFYDPSPEDDQQKNMCPLVAGDPVHVFTGNEHYSETDYVGGGTNSLRFARTYNSRGYLFDRGIGKRWSHTYSRRVRADSVIPDAIAVERETGLVIVFVPNGTGGYAGLTTATGLDYTLDKQVDGSGNLTGWLVKDRMNNSEQYDAQGRLTLMTQASGRTQTLTYSTTGLASVTDNFGHQLTFTTDTAGHITQMTAGSDVTAYAYDTNGNLSTVTYPDTKVITYLYENTSFPNALTGVLDQKNVRYATITYDSTGKATETKRPGDVEKTTITYNSNGTTSVTDANGLSWTYDFEPRQTLLMFKSKSHAATASCAANSQSKAYDDNGNATSVMDFNGNLTTYVYDLARNLETSRTEAYGTSKARTITTTWHANYRLPLTITEPGRVTTYTYDSNGNRLTKTVTDSASSQTQVWTWTYNSVGQVLTEDGPRTDVSDVTTYTYFGSSSPYYGNLATITNAAGQVTQFTSYDANGRLLSQTDPNGIVTTYTYDSRGRQLTRSSNSKTTSYEYDAVGQMTKVTLPDGNWVAYVYDDAHRLTEIRDKAGNKIVYTLDLMSRRTKEEVKDTQGGLASLLDWIKGSLTTSTPPAGPQG